MKREKQRFRIPLWLGRKQGLIEDNHRVYQDRDSLTARVGATGWGTESFSTWIESCLPLSNRHDPVPLGPGPSSCVGLRARTYVARNRAHATAPYARLRPNALTSNREPRGKLFP
jgi:hypothetical protein